MGQVVSDLVVISEQKLTPAQFSDLADVPPEVEWLANITNPKTRRAEGGSSPMCQRKVEMCGSTVSSRGDEQAHGIWV
jgi:hypothetical protein